MEPENKGETQAKIDAIVVAVERNGLFCQDLAAGLPALIAALPDGEVFDLVNTSIKSFREMWHQPEAKQFWACLAILLERDATRRALFEGYEVGQLEKLSELPGEPEA